MSLFTDRVAEVYVITNRPDLVNETAQAVKEATLKAHHLDYFSKDIFESGITFPTSEYYQVLPYKDLIPLWRTFKYLRKYDAVGATAGAFIKQIVTEKVLDSYLVSRDDICYLAGLAYNIKSSTAEQYFILGCYVHPKIDPSTYDSWIASEYPFAISYRAASQVFSDIHKEDSADKYLKLALEQYSDVTKDNITNEGS